MSNTRRHAHEHRPHQVYVLCTSTGEALYVGVTSNLAQRLKAHKSQKPWWGDVDLTRTLLTQPLSWEDALTAEEQHIRDLKPRHNRRKANGSLYVRLGVRDEVYAERNGLPVPDPSHQTPEVSEVLSAALASFGRTA